MSEQSKHQSYEIHDNWIEIGNGYQYWVQYKRPDESTGEMMVIADCMPDAYQVAFSYLNSSHEEGEAYYIIESIREKMMLVVLQKDLTDLQF